MPHATRSPHYPALPTPPAGIRHPLFVAFVALLIALFTLTPTAQARGERMGTHGQTSSGSYTLEAPAGPDGMLPPPGEYGPAEITGRRIAV